MRCRPLLQHELEANVQPITRVVDDKVGRQNSSVSVAAYAMLLWAFARLFRRSSSSWPSLGVTTSVQVLSTDWSARSLMNEQG